MICLATYLGQHHISIEAEQQRCGDYVRAALINPAEYPGLEGAMRGCEDWLMEEALEMDNEEREDFGCQFPGECCMPGPHYPSECCTAEMMDDLREEGEA